MKKIGRHEKNWTKGKKLDDMKKIGQNKKKLRENSNIRTSNFLQIFVNFLKWSTSSNCQ